MIHLPTAVTWVCALAMALSTGVGPVLAGTMDPNQVFPQLERLNPCDVAGAAYVRLAAGRWSAGDMLSYGYQPSGNAWMLSETRDPEGRRVKGTFVVDGGDVIEVHWAENPPSQKDNPFRVYGTWSPALCEADLLLVAQFLEDARTNPFLLTDSMRGRLLLFALHLRQRGSEDAAARIVQDLDKARGGLEAAFVAAMNVLADAQYRRLYRDFLADHDWPAYAKGIEELMTRHPRDWRSAAAMQMLLDRVAARLSGPPPAPHDANGLSEADLGLAARLTEIRNVRVSPSYRETPVFWLIPSSWPPDMARQGDADLEIRARGMAGLPLLLALFEDGALTGVDAHALRRSGSFQLRLSRDVERSFADICRPATRGEVAERILLEMLPADVSGGERRPKSGKDLFDAVRAFYEEHVRATDEELAVLFLLRPYGALSEPAMRILLGAAKDRPVPALDEFLVSDWRHPDNGDIDFAEMMAAKRGELFMRYAALRGAEAEPLAAKVAAWLRDFADAYDKPGISRGSPEADRKHVEEVRAKIRQVAANVEAVQYDDTALDDLLTDRLKKTDFSNWAMLTAKLQATAPQEAVGAVLRKAVEIDDPSGRRVMAYVLRQIPLASDGGGLDPTFCEDLWRVVVADDRETAKDGDNRVSDQFLCQYERLFGGRKAEDVEKLILDQGAVGREWLRRRVLDRLSGTPEAQLPKYPQDAPLSAADSAALKTRLAAVTSREQAVALVESMSVYERAALPGLLREAPDLNARLITMANTVVAVSVADAEPQFRDRLRAWVGRPVTVDLLRELQDYCKAHGSAGQGVLCLAARNGHLAGCEITVRTLAEEQGKETKGMSGLACAPGVYAVADWRLVPLPEKPSWRTFQTSEPDVIRDLERAMADAFGPAVDASSAAIVRFHTKGGVE